MLFGNHKEIASLQNKLAGLEDSHKTLQSEHEALALQFQELQAENVRLTTRSEFYAGIFNGMQSFGASFSEFQKSLMNLANSLREEKDHALNASSTSINSRSAMEQISRNLLRMAQKTQSTAHSVDQLSQRADQIGGIIKLIKEIADQTNLLALNAAIEAARAGEEGRGFAVVADEVRKLAERTASATKEIREMITNIQEQAQEAVTRMDSGMSKMEEGLRLAAEAASDKGEIQAITGRMFVTINQIASGAQNLSSRVSSITVSADTARKALDDAAHSAGRTGAGAIKLDKLVGQFRVSGV